MKLDEGMGLDNVISAELLNASGRQQRLSIDGNSLTLSEGTARLRCWPLHVVRIKTDLPGGSVSVEAGGETLTWTCSDEKACVALAQMSQASAAPAGPPSDAALAALLEDAEPDDADAERRVRRLGERLARLDALNVGGMLAAATEGGGARLAARLEVGGEAGAALTARLGRLEALTRAAPAALHARSGAARADAAARALLAELTEIYAWLDAPELRDLDSLAEVSLASVEGRARALAAAEALRAALSGERVASAARLRLGAVRERLRRLARARDALAAALARHLNNALIHLGNEAGVGTATAETEASGARRHHAELLPYAPFMRWLREMDSRAWWGLWRVYVGTWARAYEREVRVACEAARTTLAAAAPERADEVLDEVLTLVETMCNAEQDFCTQFFNLEADTKGDSDGDGSRSEGERSSPRRAPPAARRLLADLFPALEAELVALVAHIERSDPYGAMRALACVGRRVLGESGETGEGSAGEARWARAALAAVAVAAKRGADRAVADRLAALPEAVRAAARRPKCGVLSFIPELEEMAAECERIFARGRRADLERWYGALASGMLRAVAAAEHPRTPRAVVQLENYHRLHAAVSALRVPALEAQRREARARYAEALRQYVTTYFGRPLERLAQFFEGVAEAVAAGVREDEVCYRAAFSKHELRRVLALYPAGEVRRALHRLYRTVDKHVSAEGGLLQVVWRAMQEEFIAQHVALQARIAACYPGAGLALPLTTQDILDAFSDIAQEH